MSTNSEVGKLISANSHLSNPTNPFGSYYAYYLLAEKLQLKLEEFFNSGNNSFLKEISSQLPNEASAYICHKSEYVKNDATINLKSLMLGFLGIKVSRSKIEEIERPSFGGLDWEIMDIQRKKLDEKWATNDRAERDRRIGDFWRRARNCNLGLGQSSQEGHTSIDLMNLISACSGYRNFADFLDKEFGNDYNPAKDETLPALTGFTAGPVGLVEEKEETEGSLQGAFVFYLQQVKKKFSRVKRRRKKLPKQVKVPGEKTTVIPTFQQTQITLGFAGKSYWAVTPH